MIRLPGCRALSRVGVTFTDTQKEMITKLQESGDLMGAQNIILEELESEYGRAAAAARETFTGSLIATNGAISDYKKGDRLCNCR